MELPVHLKNNECFVFQSNANGFHGSGSAGWAFRGTATDWRKDKKFVKQWKTGLSYRGKWAQLRKPHGLQCGEFGMSWAICTTIQANEPRSISLNNIKQQIIDLLVYSRTEAPNINFIFASIGSGHAGYHPTEMWDLYQTIFTSQQYWPPNWFCIINSHRMNLHKVYDSLINKQVYQIQETSHVEPNKTVQTLSISMGARRKR